jgi:hypothetical protein
MPKTGEGRLGSSVLTPKVQIHEKSVHGNSSNENFKPGIPNITLDFEILQRQPSESSDAKTYQPE